MKKFQPINSSRNANLLDGDTNLNKGLDKYKEYTRKYRLKLMRQDNEKREELGINSARYGSIDST